MSRTFVHHFSYFAPDIRLARKISEIAYNVSSGMFNPTQFNSIHIRLFEVSSVRLQIRDG